MYPNSFAVGGIVPELCWLRSTLSLAGTVTPINIKLINYYYIDGSGVYQGFKNNVTITFAVIRSLAI